MTYIIECYDAEGNLSHVQTTESKGQAKRLRIQLKTVYPTVKVTEAIDAEMYAD